MKLEDYDDSDIIDEIYERGLEDRFDFANLHEDDCIDYLEEQGYTIIDPKKDYDSNAYIGYVLELISKSSIDQKQGKDVSDTVEEIYNILRNEVKELNGLYFY